MEKKQSAPDISEAVGDIVLKLNQAGKITIKTQTNPVTQGFLLSQIIKRDDLKSGPVLILAKDEFAKLNIIQALSHWGMETKKDL